MIDQTLKSAVLRRSQWYDLDTAPRDGHTYIFFWGRNKRCPVTAVYSRENDGWNIVDWNGNVINTISDEYATENGFRWLPVHEVEEKAVLISLATWYSFNLFLVEYVSKPGIPKGFLNMCDDGSVHVQWFTEDGTRLSVEFFEDKVNLNVVYPGDENITRSCSIEEALKGVQEFFHDPGKTPDTCFSTFDGRILCNTCGGPISRGLTRRSVGLQEKLTCGSCGKTLWTKTTGASQP